ncbi:MAG: hypothetical protein JJU45_18190 [Acidimicrobiia bacterium]|nr:hypothetical protein [Acidimicrobiia bacterium]
MTSPPPAVRQVLQWERNGRTDLLVHQGPDVAASLGSADDTRRWVPTVVLATGAALASSDSLSTARRWLTEGLTMCAAPIDPEGSADGARVTTDRYELTLVEILLHQGVFAEASQRVATLAVADRAIETRFAATRASAHLHLLAGDAGRASFVLNTAAHLAERCRSRFGLGLVEADRAVVLAGGGRATEAVQVLLGVADDLTSMRSGPTAAQARATAAVACATVARAAADTGDLFDAQQLLATASRAAQLSNQLAPSPTHGVSMATQAHVYLGAAALARAEGDTHRAAQLASDARRAFTDTGGRPGAAMASRELGVLALHAGRLASAGPLLELASREFAALGLPVEHDRTGRLLADLRAS